MALLAVCASDKPGTLRTAKAQDAVLSPVAKELVPTFKLRTRAVTAAGKPVDGETFFFQLHSPSHPIFSTSVGQDNPRLTDATPLKATGSAWSDWGTFSQAAINEVYRPGTYLNAYLNINFPIVLFVSVNEFKGGYQVYPATPIKIEVQVQFDESPDKPVTLTSTLIKTPTPGGPTLGLMLWREDAAGKFWAAGGQPEIATFREYNRLRYWSKLKDARIPAVERPKKFVLADMFRGDNDQDNWREAFQVFVDAGYTAIGPEWQAAAFRVLMLASGLQRTVTAGYAPPSYIQTVPQKDLDAWAQSVVQPWLDAGWKPEDVALYALADEPNWYYPQLGGAGSPNIYEIHTTHPDLLKRFRSYLQEQDLKPADVGATDWEQVKFIGSGGAIDLPTRRLFYWTMRFFDHDSAMMFANSTQALEKAMGGKLPGVFTNWNTFTGRFYSQGPSNHQPLPASPDAAAGGHDWFEFGKQRGGTMLWTSDWFGDYVAPEMSFRMDKLRSASAKGGLPFGSYVVVGVSGSLRYGLLQKALSIVGHGGKAIFYYGFGPEYMFRGAYNSYSDTPGAELLLPRVAEANHMIAKAEDVLWPGKKQRAQVAMLFPQSAQLWDMPTPTEASQKKSIVDAANGGMNTNTVDYMAEIYNLYTALQHANIPVDFVTEDDLTTDSLSAYKVLYVTAPNIPTEGIESIKTWVKNGGTLATTSMAGTSDRYNEPSKLLSSFTEFREPPRERWIISNLAWDAKPAGEIKATGGTGTARAIQVRSSLAGSAPTGMKVVANWSDNNSPAIVQRAIGKGRVFHYSFLPGISYILSSSEMKNIIGNTPAKDKLPTGYSTALRDWIISPVKAGRVETPVQLSTPLVETPMLLSDKGAAVTLLNWNNEPQKNLDLAIKVPFVVGSISSVQRGKLTFRHEAPNKVRVTLPRLDAADILMLRK